MKMRWLLALLTLGLVLAPDAAPQEDELEAIAEWRETVALEEKRSNRQMANVERISNDASAPPERLTRARSALREQRGRLFKARAEYKLAVSEYNAAIAPTLTLYKAANDALGKISAIQDQGNKDVQRSKAVARATIIRDMNTLLPSLKPASSTSWERLESLIKGASSSSQVKDQIKSIFDDDPAVQEAVGLAWTVTGNEVLKAAQPDRLNAWNKAMSQLGFVVKTAHVVYGDPNTKPLESDVFARLMMLNDAIGDMPGGKAIGLKLLSVQNKLVLQKINEDITSLNHTVAHQNLINLVSAANAGTIACPHPNQLIGNETLFASLMRFPYLDVDTVEGTAGTTFSGDWCSGMDFEPHAWLGIILADRYFDMESDRTSESVNDAHDQDYITIGEQIGGRFSFQTNSKWPLGTHFIRMFNSDNRDGKMIESEDIKIISCGGQKYFNTNKQKYIMGEPIIVSYCGLEYDVNADNGYITVVPSSADKGDYEEWNWTHSTEGKLTFSSELRPGTYQARYHQDYRNNDDKIFEQANFEIVARPWLTGVWEVSSGHYAGMRVLFNPTKNGLDGHIIFSTQKSRNKYLPTGMLMFQDYEIVSGVSAWGNCKSYYTSHKFRHFGITYHPDDDEISANCPDQVRLERVTE